MPVTATICLACNTAVSVQHRFPFATISPKTAPQSGVCPAMATATATATKKEIA